MPAKTEATHDQIVQQHLDALTSLRDQYEQNVADGRRIAQNTADTVRRLAELGVRPTTMSTVSGLSRQTIHRHLADATAADKG